MGRPRIPVIAGDKFGRWTIFSEADPSNPESGQRQRRFTVVCECGTERVVLLNSLRNGDSQSCGCLSAELSAERNTKHGMTGHALYTVWLSMIQRCYDENHKRYKDWGGRGITVCKSWRDDPTEFCKWAIINGYKKGLQLDKIDNGGNYCPSNCRFITPKENCRNKRTSYWYHHGGKTYDAGIDLAEVLGVCLQTINNWCNDPSKPEFKREHKYKKA